MMWLFGRGASEETEKIGEYTLGAVIGRGSFGVVKAAQHALAEDKVAIKIASKTSTKASEGHEERLRAEIRNHRLMSHPHVVQIHEVIECDAAFNIVMELVTGGDLFDYIVKHSHPRLPEETGRRLFQQIVAGVEHCHGRGVVHRDLKPENIFVDASGNAKLGDFGLSSEWRKGGILTDSCGSPNYAAPELLSKGCQYEGPEVDVWSLGVVLYTLLCNALPFDAPDFPKLFKAIRSGRYSVPGFVNLDAKDILGIMIVVDPAKRAQIADIWKHSWFQNKLPAELTSGTATKKTVAALPMLLGRGTRAGSSFPMVAKATSEHQGTSTSVDPAINAAALPARGDKLLKKCASVAVGKSTSDASAAALLAELQAASFAIKFAKQTKHGRSTSDEDMTPSTQDATPSALEVDPRSDRMYSADVAMHAFVNNFAF